MRRRAGVRFFLQGADFRILIGENEFFPNFSGFQLKDKVLKRTL
jgi:hypothetical protein